MNIYTEDKPYCVYLTIYRGNKLPPFYIGSTRVEKVLNEGYHGTVRSKRYKTLWKSEIQLHPELFSTRVVTLHETRDQAITKEGFFQRQLKVVKSPMYVNQAIAAPNGFFGMDMKGPNNPRFGKIPWNKGKTVGQNSDESNARRSQTLKGRKFSKLHKKRIGDAHRGKSKPKQSQSQVLAKSNTYEVTSPCGEVLIVTNMNTFCRQHGLTPGALRSVARGEATHHKGFKSRVIR